MEGRGRGEPELVSGQWTVGMRRHDVMSITSSRRRAGES